MKAESLIFDVDGTLWNSVPLVAKGWNLGMESFGLPGNFTADGIRPLFGKTMDQIAAAVLPQFSKEEQLRKMDLLMDWEFRVLKEDPCAIFYPGVLEGMKALAKTHRIFLASNCQMGYIELVLEKGHLAPLVTDHSCFGETGTCKAETIRRLMARNQVYSAVYIGDTQGDLEAAEGAGIPFIWASYGFGTPDHWDLQISEFSELLTAFA